MDVSHSRIYICSFCPNSVEKETDGFIIFGGFAITSSRGLKTQYGLLPITETMTEVVSKKTVVCMECFKKKFDL